MSSIILNLVLVYVSFFLCMARFLPLGAQLFGQSTVLGKLLRSARPCLVRSWSLVLVCNAVSAGLVTLIAPELFLAALRTDRPTSFLILGLHLS